MLSRDNRDSWVSAEINLRIEAEVPEVRGHKDQPQAEAKLPVRTETRDVSGHLGDSKL